VAGTIVVGVDGSDESKAALRFALEEAKLRGAKLRCIHAWAYPYMGDPTGLATAVAADLFGRMSEDAQAQLTGVVAEVAGGSPGVEIEQAVAEGPPASVLIDAAEHADLLVVGSRGRGGFAGLILGSVSHQCASHAPCPVVIVPHRAGEQT
jgi:nucleotide-binding universal stress UspA family protein